jgi:hypothetical protein
MGYELFYEVNKYLEGRGIPKSEINKLEFFLDSLIFRGRPDFVLEELRKWEVAHGLSDYRRPLAGESMRLTRTDGIAKIMELANAPCIIGLCGRPAVGKSRLLRELSRKGLDVIDEFGCKPQYSDAALEELEWAASYHPEILSDKTHNEKKAEKTRASGKTVVVAGARLVYASFVRTPIASSTIPSMPKSQKVLFWRESLQCSFNRFLGLCHTSCLAMSSCTFASIDISNPFTSASNFTFLKYSASANASES